MRTHVSGIAFLMIRGGRGLLCRDAATLKSRSPHASEPAQHSADVAPQSFLREMNDNWIREMIAEEDGEVRLRLHR